VPAPGLRLTVLAGPTVPVPLPAPFTARLRSLEFTDNDEERSVFTLTFDAGRSRVGGRLDVAGLQDSPVGAFARIGVVLTFGTRPAVLLDGIVTDVALTPGHRPGEATLTVTGEDVSYLLDRVEYTAEHAALDDTSQVRKILAGYLTRGIASMVVPASTSDAPSPTERIPTQQTSDLAHVTELARRNGYVACALPGPTPGTSTFYWGPPLRSGPPQPALSVDLGPDTNCAGLSFRTDALAPALINGAVLDRHQCAAVPVSVEASSLTPLAERPLWSTHAGDIRRRLLRDAGSDAVAARARAQAEVDRSIDAVVATGTVDGTRYGQVLRPRGLVGMRGAGRSHDGFWYVRQVVHTLAVGSYRQKVTLVRDGYGSTVLAVPVGSVG